MVNWKDIGKELPAKNKEFSHLLDLLKDAPGVAIAFSGGADSAFLLAAALIAGVKSVLPVTIVSDFFTVGEKDRVIRLGQYLGITPILVPANILEDARVTRNTDRRCYFCKLFLFSKVMEVAKKRGIHTLLHGANLDDLQEFRPGMDAARELGFKTPLVAAGFSKEQIRACSKTLGLETWNLPAQSCLATRIPQGDIITKEKLVRVELAEECLHRLGFGQVRVRCHGDMARIEADLYELQRFVEPNVRQEVIQTFKRAGFYSVCLDLDGYASASGVQQ
ncbi:ATP-dependent sacrificial sulfur transferase LarE [Desulfobacter hydrogenophilus]|uniref:ATP-dependent sacrificial sulfur transferase LarE n=1 Tax=Desulfobacter hydrogenophilus TaxID=2291 RepID=A0A328F815_9BACT|nr:ATP-dependent sacrificial sulfur transferase LarE [Desulfobacter hydrogenophilus]NDY73232.1 ATP-dependent sacrificial sulfur transferase LarE [Desulfobacter hydrogenophilus]QBH13810.1 ATP-dependent sacrificial sulfur transferase LarE [Desulfobacter hydrogenophilus]RAM00824.1 ATP-dependent sacrificial sulfur transferase LarE [Desulfobacter hydrogenophilus]